MDGDYCGAEQPFVLSPGQRYRLLRAVLRTAYVRADKWLSHASTHEYSHGKLPLGAARCRNMT